MTKYNPEIGKSYKVVAKERGGSLRIEKEVFVYEMKEQLYCTGPTTPMIAHHFNTPLTLFDLEEGFKGSIDYYPFGDYWWVTDREYPGKHFELEGLEEL